MTDTESQNQSRELNEAVVLEYLKANKDFLAKYPELNASKDSEKKLPKGVFSFSQKQNDNLRAENDQVKEQLRSLTSIVKENEGHWATLKKLCMFMLENKQSIQKNPGLLTQWMKKHYQLYDVIIQLPEQVLVNVEDNKSKFGFEDSSVEIEIQARISSGYAYCDNRMPKKLMEYFFEDKLMVVGSCAVIPLNFDLKSNGSIDKGVLILADKFSNRFHNHSDMSYVNELGSFITSTFIDSQK